MVIVEWCSVLNRFLIPVLDTSIRHAELALGGADAEVAVMMLARAMTSNKLALGGADWARACLLRRRFDTTRVRGSHTHGLRLALQCILVWVAYFKFPNFSVFGVQ